MSALKKCKLAICVFGCVTKEKYSQQVDKIIETWGVDADNNSVPILFILGEEKNDKYVGDKFIYLNGIDNDLRSASYKQWLGLKFIYENYDPEFVICCGTDTFVNIPKLLKFLEKHDSTDKLYIGGKGMTVPINGKAYYFHSGGPGFVISKKLLEVLYPMLHNIMEIWLAIVNTESVRNTGCNFDGSCDIGMAYFASENGATTIRDDAAFANCNHQGIPHRRGKFRIQDAISLHYMNAKTCDDYWKILKSNNYFL
jgi:hypothetical protein